MPRAKSSTRSRSKTAKQPSFEQSLEQLETLVEALEEGDLSLEQALDHFEQGVTLTRSCQQQLDQAEQKIKVLIEKDGEPALTTMDDALAGDTDAKLDD